MPETARRLLVSVHDVMPETLAATAGILERLDTYGIRKVTLLVVPGRDWRAADIDALRGLVAAGAELAGHGWTHAARHIRGWRHRLHSCAISRTTAEHLALGPDAVRQLVAGCRAWFPAHGLPLPGLYVPPAWALNLNSAERVGLPFRQIETLAGVWFVQERRFRHLPMVGFEADTVPRALACRAWNAVNWHRARDELPVRLAIHPQDFELKLAEALRRKLACGGQSMSYSDLPATG